ncbi:MAG: hypothetical protein ACYS22_15255 [Planctomycetota bacterium]|jgi:hypothetical protein
MPAPTQSRKTEDLPGRGIKISAGGDLGELEARIASERDAIGHLMPVLRESVQAFSHDWLEKAAKAVAISQHEHTLAMGRTKLGELKAELRQAPEGFEDRVRTALPDDIASEFDSASSGQVHTLLGRLLEQKLRTILALRMPLLEAYGYKRDEHWPQPGTGSEKRYRKKIELPPDLKDVARRLGEAVINIKVLDSKILFQKRKKKQQLAIDLWETA